VPTGYSTNVAANLPPFAQGTAFGQYRPLQPSTLAPAYDQEGYDAGSNAAGLPVEASGQKQT